MMRHCSVGIPKEIKPEEKRVAGLPEHVQRLRELGVDVLVQRDAGTASGHPDAEYERAGAELVETLEEVYARADLLWKVKEPLPPEYGLLRPDHIVFTYLHPAPRPRMVEALLAARCIAIAYEEVTDEQGRRPLLAPMSRIAGAGAIAIAAQFTQSIYGGVGKSLFTVEGADPMRVTILGGGTAGRTAAQAALGAGARITVLEASPEVATGLRRTFARACVELSSEDAIRRLLPETDVLVNCIYWMPGDPHLVTREMLALMPRGALIVDVAADPHGAIETSEETTHAQPIRVVDGILHYCVQNIPALFPRTASSLLSQATWPYLERMIRDGVAAAIREDPMLRRGVSVWRGELVGEELGRALKRDALAPDDLLAEIGTAGE